MAPNKQTNFWTWCVARAPLQVPGLAVIIVGSRKDSQTYVRMKKKACADVGILSFETALPEDATEAAVIAAVRKFNYHPGVHGILVQLPLPDRIDEERVLGAVALEKDVDGFHPIHVGQLCMKVCSWQVLQTCELDGQVVQTAAHFASLPQQSLVCQDPLM